MVDMNPQELRNFAESMAGKVPDQDEDDTNNDVYNRPQSGEGAGDPRTKRPTFDLYKVDFAWVEKETNRRELRGAYQALKEDNGFPDLLKAVEKKLKQVDPKFRTASDFNNYTPADERAANDDVLAFLDEMNEADKKLRG